MGMGAPVFGANLEPGGIGKLILLANHGAAIGIELYRGLGQRICSNAITVLPRACLLVSYLYRPLGPSGR